MAATAITITTASSATPPYTCNTVIASIRSNIIAVAVVHVFEGSEHVVDWLVLGVHHLISREGRFLVLEALVERCRAFIVDFSRGLRGR